ncbi:hypothetical protein [uncultured Aquimarina sp.]|uniref:hypothetical protein n=1 Tax=uncultured Aquimarina sp. TaxID=575652 RepID=UPI002630A54C|nr:hypothetical protein [uncultured Aquimarina sp.]
MIKRSLLILFLLIFICSCGIFKDKNLAKRYRNRTNLGTFKNSSNPQLFVQVDLNTILIPSPKKDKINYNVLSLSDKGQEAYITSLNSKTSKEEELIESINTNFQFTKFQKSKTKIIPNTIKKTLIFTVDRLHSYEIFDTISDNPIKTTTVVFNNLGDRVSFLELGLKLPKGDGTIFNSWDKYVTDKVTLNLGNVSSAQNWNASVSASAKGTGVVSLIGSNSKTENLNSTESNSILLNTGNNNTDTTSYQIVSDDNNADTNTNSISSTGELGGSATIGYTDTYQTSLILSSEVLKLSGTLSEKNVLLRQEGGPGIDLSGNIVVSVEYKLDEDWAIPIKFNKLSKLYNDSGKPNKPTDITNDFLMVLFPDLKKDVNGELEYKFLYRQVNKGNRHIPEARQKVTYYHGDVKSNENYLLKDNKGLITLVKKEEVRPKGYLINLKKSGNIKLNKEELKFETISEAINFLAYLNDLIAKKIPLANVYVNGKTLSFKDVSELQIITNQF